VKIVDRHDTKTTLSEVVEQAKNGDEVILARAGKLVARVVAIQSAGPRTLGQWRGRVRMSDDFDASLHDDELAGWHAGNRS
jgi:antitoxin (DNA-binding transcriptional repressor) of toxin-antitoxin stability system